MDENGCEYESDDERYENNGVIELIFPKIQIEKTESLETYLLNLHQTRLAGPVILLNLSVQGDGNILDVDGFES